MKNYFFALLLSLFSSALPLAAKETPAAAQTEKQEKTDIAKISEAFGHLIGKNIETIGIKFDIAQVIKGLQDGSKGKDSPMTEEECVAAISAAQELHFKELALENLKKAEEFLSANQKNKEVQVLEEGKLQYKIEKQGSGSSVEEHFSPVIRYVGKYLDGTVFGASKEEDLISLDETIPGITKGVIGMKEGEKRILYIHPSLGYGVSGHLPPNSLLTFEIEVIKASGSKKTNEEQLSSDAHPVNPEIATPSSKTEALR